MTLDGSLYDSLTGEPVNRFFRPATLEHALLRYPLFVYRLKQGRLTISTAKSVEMPPVVRASVPGRREETWVMLRTDFEKCKAVAAKVDVRLFPTEPPGSVLDRIKAHLLVEFGPGG